MDRVSFSTSRKPASARSSTVGMVHPGNESMTLIRIRASRHTLSANVLTCSFSPSFTSGDVFSSMSFSSDRMPCKRFLYWNMGLLVRSKKLRNGLRHFVVLTFLVFGCAKVCPPYDDVPDEPTDFGRHQSLAQVGVALASPFEAGGRGIVGGKFEVVKDRYPNLNRPFSTNGSGAGAVLSRVS